MATKALSTATNGVTTATSAAAAALNEDLHRSVADKNRNVLIDREIKVYHLMDMAENQNSISELEVSESHSLKMVSCTAASVKTINHVVCSTRVSANNTHSSGKANTVKETYKADGIFVYGSGVEIGHCEISG